MTLPFYCHYCDDIKLMSFQYLSRFSICKLNLASNNLFFLLSIANNLILKYGRIKFEVTGKMHVSQIVKEALVQR